MKKALVVIEEFLNRSVGHIDAFGSAEDIDSRNGNYYDKMEKVTIAESLGVFDFGMFKTVKPNNGEGASEFWFKADSIVSTQPLVTAWQHNDTDETVYEDPMDEDNYTEVNVVDPSYIYHPAEVEDQWNVVLDMAKYKAQEVVKAYNEMNEEVYAEMSNVFGTSNSESANAYNETYKLMQSSPSSFSGVGLVATIDTANFSKGDALDSDSKVSDFAGEALDKIDAYAVWRMVRIKQFSDKKTTIENA